jgi:hypothetical protein
MPEITLANGTKFCASSAGLSARLMKISVDAARRPSSGGFDYEIALRGGELHAKDIRYRYLLVLLARGQK